MLSTNFDSINKIKSELQEQGIILFKNMSHKTNEQLLDWAQKLSPRTGEIQDKILHWDFGPIMEMKFNPEANNYLFSKERVPLHWDGAFHKEPHFLLFYCDKSSGEGGETLFCDTQKAFNSFSEIEQKAAENIELEFKTEKKAHYGGEIKVSFLQRHPDTGNPILRFAEEVKTELNPVFRKVYGDVLNIIPKLENQLDQFSYAHSWKQGDLLVVDNFRFIHGRRSLKNNTERSFRRIQIM